MTNALKTVTLPEPGTVVYAGDCYALVIGTGPARESGSILVVDAIRLTGPHRGTKCMVMHDSTKTGTVEEIIKSHQDLKCVRDVLRS